MNTTITNLTLIKPDDWHCHLRDEERMQAVVNHSAKQFRRIIVMPNLIPPIVNIEMALDYRDRILKANQIDNFQPLMTLYLTDSTTPEDIKQLAQHEFVKAVKLYPSGATTNSNSGVTDIVKRYDIFQTMQQYQIPLLIHAEVTDPDIDVFDREKAFIDKHLQAIVHQFPELKLVFEHVTTEDGVEFVKSHSHLAATITPQHLLFNRNDMLVGGIKPHYYCLPILKRNIHQQMLINAAISGNPQFFLGTDSAPHPQSAKESCCGCAGVYSSHAAIEIYAHIFEQHQALHRLENFASVFGAQYYQLPINDEKITLHRESWTIPEYYDFGAEKLVPLLAGQTLNWRLQP